MKRKRIGSGTCGFSLVELMIVVLIAGAVSGAAYAMYSVQQRSYLMQEQLVDMQQNVRSFLYYIEKDLRMAGYNPRQVWGVGGFSTAKSTEVVFSADIGRPRSSPVFCEGAGCDSMPDESIITSPCTSPAVCVTETIRYALPSSNPTPQSNGQVDATTVTTVQKTFNGTTSDKSQTVVENVQALEFLYNLNDGRAETDVATADLGNIRSVTVSLLMRTHNTIKGYRSINKCPEGCYYPASNADKSGAKKWGPFDDSYRRRLVVTNIQCRNMATRVVDY